jgi:beta-phosphoglucomutase-like phosphatase (HAD superfamily)
LTDGKKLETHRRESVASPTFCSTWTARRGDPPPGARKLLVWSTQAAIPWAIATSSRMETAAVNLAALDVDPVQIPVITRDQVRYAKPDPDLFLAAS